MQEELFHLKKLIEQKMREEQVQRSEENGDLIGELPTEIVGKLYKLRKVKERLTEDVELRQHQLSLEMQRRMEEEFEERQEAYASQHKQIWSEVYKTMLIDPNGSYFQEDGKLYQYGNGKSKTTFKMVDFQKPRR